jgi:phenylalanyl-tRNA synthetase alpha chain
MQKNLLSRARLAAALALPDLSEPSEPPHAIHLIVCEILHGLQVLGWPAATVRRGPRVVTAQDNYGLLGYRPDEVTLGSAHTRWVTESTLLRTQMTSQIPPALVTAAAVRAPGDSVLIAAPGITYRRDTRDRWHCAEPHQMDLWVLGDPSLGTHAHLLRLVGDVLSIAVPGHRWTAIDSPHHYTDGGIEVNVSTDTGPVEVLECGLIARSLLLRLGIDPEQHGGLALGLGLDRLVMLRKAIPDIRLLRDIEPRVAAQMHDLEPWRPVSRLPATSRDLSLAVAPGQSDEALTDKVLVAAGDRADWIETVTIEGRWRAEQLPAQAIERLGLRAQQENVLIRVTLRDWSRSIPRSEANALYARLQEHLHEGTPGGGYRLAQVS